ncbi:2Fe-2S iron-sulfur cluster binding domain-containing protein, partial [Arthrobacter deserti]|nr:2Fe-2S iron-sulfur cluster binding domain-containing protein [Arthrobacter deserti]
EPFRMRIASAGRVLDVPAGASALDVLERAGVYVPRMCRQGICGECRVEVSSGEVIHRDIYLDDAEKQSNTAMMCCVSRAAGEVVLDV